MYHNRITHKQYILLLEKFLKMKENILSLYKDCDKYKLIKYKINELFIYSDIINDINKLILKLGINENDLIDINLYTKINDIMSKSYTHISVEELVYVSYSIEYLEEKINYIRSFLYILFN